MEVLLIEPPSTTSFGNLRILGSSGTLKTDMCWPPLDLMLIGGVLKKGNIDYEIYDAQVLRANFDDLEEIVRLKNPRAVVFSTSTATIYSDLKVAGIVKRVSKDILTVAFGIHISALPEETMKLSENLDIAVYQPEPELCILDLIRANYNPSSVRGLVYRKNGRICKTGVHPGYNHRDELGFPAHDKIPVHLYYDPHMRRGPLTMTLAQQGCINNCIYCVCPQFYGKLKQRSVEHVIEELQWVEELGIKEIRFFDSGITHDWNWVNALLNEMIEKKLNLKWACNVRADKFSLNLARKMKAAGCHTIWIGCESADKEILKTIGKNETPEIVAEAVKNARKGKLDVQVYFILGLPGENEKTMKKTIEFARKVSPDIITLNIAVPLPGTRFYEYVVRNGFLKTKDWSQYDPVSKPVFEYPQLSGERIYQVMRRGYRSFYLTPTYLWRRLGKIRDILTLRNNLRNLRGFVRRYLLEGST